MAAKVFVLKKPAKCADCGKELPAGTQVRGYPLPNGGWKIYCLKHPKGERQAAGNPPPSDPPQAGSPKPADEAPADVGWKEVLEALLRIEGKLNVLIALLEGKDENTSPARQRKVMGDEVVSLGFIRLAVWEKHQKPSPQPAESSPQGMAHFPLFHCKAQKQQTLPPVSLV